MTSISEPIQGETDLETLFSLGIDLYYRQKNQEHGLEAFNRGRQLAESCQNQPMLTRFNICLGSHYRHWGHHYNQTGDLAHGSKMLLKSSGYINAAYESALTLDDPKILLDATGQMVLLREQTGETPEQVLETYLAALPTARSIDDKGPLIDYLTNAGRILTELEQYQDANAFFSEAEAALENFNGTQDSREFKRMWLSIRHGEYYLATGKIDEASPLLNEGYTLAAKRQQEDALHYAGIALEKAGSFSDDRLR